LIVSITTYFYYFTFARSYVSFYYFYTNKTMKHILIFLLNISALQSFSQESSYQNYYWNGGENYEAMIAATNCYVRETPSLNGILLDSLQVGKEIKVIKSTTNDLKIKGINVSWVEIEYTNKASILSKGFLWKGFLAVGFTKKGENIYLTAIDKIETKKEKDFEIPNFSIVVKILDANNLILDQKTIQKNITESASFDGKAIGDLGLKNLQDIYRISFNGEACAIPSLFYYFGWNGSKLILLPEKYSVGDAGVFYHTENFVFPKEKGGKPDLIIKQIEEAESTDENAEVFSITEHKEIYTWDGENATFLKKEKTRKYKKKL
jgi:hypothetical protein